jgi:hypothetical protein
MLAPAMMNRNSADAQVPTISPTAFKFSNRDSKAAAVKATLNEIAITTAECPSEKKKPAATGRLPSCMSLRVTLSMTAM